ncbi:MAG: UpxY family transcription antiterminator [Saprospiraceae bacterium]|nr:UpxY family transcription antiterminator [Saprospiraceae bacterium]
MPSTTVTSALHESQPRWFAIQTRAKSEKAVLRNLSRKGVHAYLPLQKLYRRYQRSTRLAELPLIRGYVFVRIVQKDYVRVLETEHVCGFVQIGKNLAPIPEAEIQLLRRITLEDGLDLEAQPGALLAGDPVEIRAGNLTGLRGTIAQVDGKNRFLVELERLGYRLLITIDAAFLEKTRLNATTPQN